MAFNRENSSFPCADQFDIWGQLSHAENILQGRFHHNCTPFIGVVKPLADMQNRIEAVEHSEGQMALNWHCIWKLRNGHFLLNVLRSLACLQLNSRERFSTWWIPPRWQNAKLSFSDPSFSCSSCSLPQWHFYLFLEMDAELQMKQTESILSGNPTTLQMPLSGCKITVYYWCFWNNNAVYLQIYWKMQFASICNV